MGSVPIFAISIHSIERNLNRPCNRNQNHYSPASLRRKWTLNHPSSWKDYWYGWYMYCTNMETKRRTWWNSYMYISCTFYFQTFILKGLKFTDFEILVSLFLGEQIYVCSAKICRVKPCCWDGKQTGERFIVLPIISLNTSISGWKLHDNKTYD